MKKTAPEITRQLKILHGGGADAVRVFLDTSRQAFEKKDPEVLDDWVSIALPAMNEETLQAIVCGLLRVLYSNATILSIEEDVPPTLN